MKTAQPADRPGEGLRVLIVDDEAAFAETVKEALERVGYECQVAQSGKAGLREIEAEELAVILADRRLGDMSGLELLGKAKQEQPDAEVVVITGHSDVKTAVEAMQEGAANYLTKSGNLSELRTIV